MTLEAASDDELILDKNGCVATLTINNPDVRKAMKFAIEDKLAELCRAIEADPDIRELLSIQSGEGGLT